MPSNADCRSTFAVSGTIALAMLMSTASVVPTTTTTSHTATASSTATTTGAMGGVASMGFTGIGTNIAILVAVANVVAATRVAGAILLHIVIGALSRGFPAKRARELVLRISWSILCGLPLAMLAVRRTGTCWRT